MQDVILTWVNIEKLQAAGIIEIETEIFKAKMQTSQSEHRKRGKNVYQKPAE